MAMMSIPAGQITGKFGLKKITLITSFLFIVISILNVLVISSEQFLICRMLLGFILAFINKFYYLIYMH